MVFRRGTVRNCAWWAAALVGVFLIVGGPSAASSGSHFYPCTKLPRFTQYSLGPSYNGLKPKKDYTCGRPYPGEPVRENSVVFFYGPEACPDSCAAEIEVATHPACDRNLWDYTVDPEGNRPAYRLTRIRGVPAAAFNLGGSPRLELYTGDVTIVLFGRSHRALRRAAAALRTAGGSHDVDRTERLPRPAKGHLAGRLACGLVLSEFRLVPDGCVASDKCEVTMHFRLPRRAFVEARIEQQTSEGAFEPMTVEQFDAPTGVSNRVLRLTRGRFRVTIRGMDRLGRRSPATRSVVDVA